MADPDRLVEWEKIEEIHIDTLEPILCPICLYEPTAGKMTKCGHIYCWSCILHYLSLSDKPWRKCPICYESIYKADLKSVRVIKHAKEYRVGDDIQLNLMFKSKSKYSTICLPASLHDQFVMDEKQALTYDLFDCGKYEACKPYLKIHAKLAHGIYEEVVKRERCELEKQLEAEKDQPEVCFVHEALNLLEQREIKLNEEMMMSVKNCASKKEKSVKEEEIAIKPSVRYVDAFDEEVFVENQVNQADLKGFKKII